MAQVAVPAMHRSIYVNIVAGSKGRAITALLVERGSKILRLEINFREIRDGEEEGGSVISVNVILRPTKACASICSNDLACRELHYDEAFALVVAIPVEVGTRVGVVTLRVAHRVEGSAGP